MEIALLPRTTMSFYFMFPAGSKTSFMILTQCCRFRVLLTCTVWRPLGWMTAFIQNFTGDDVKYKDHEYYFMKSKLKFSLWMDGDKSFLLYSSKINALPYFSKAFYLNHQKPFSFLL